MAERSEAEVEGSRLPNLSEAHDPALRAECIRVARRVRRAGAAVIGLMPSSEGIGVPAIAIHLGRALGEVAGSTVALVDANPRWPVFSALQPEGEEGGQAPLRSLRWLDGSLAVLSPPGAASGPIDVAALAALIEGARPRFGILLVDLTGFKRLGEHLAAIALTDGVLIVGRAGETREAELLRLNHELPRIRNLGVLLLGGGPPAWG